VLRFYGRASELPERARIDAIHLTITHTAATAAAVVILERNV
jgi:phosphopantetheinyl transferase (holo-ACP synthase)